MSRKREREERPNSYNGRGGYESDNKIKKSGMNMKRCSRSAFALCWALCLSVAA